MTECTETNGSLNGGWQDARHWARDVHGSPGDVTSPAATSREIVGLSSPW